MILLEVVETGTKLSRVLDSLVEQGAALGWTLIGKVKKEYFIATSLINKKARHITSGLNDNINNSVIKD